MAAQKKLGIAALWPHLFAGLAHIVQGKTGQPAGNVLAAQGLGHKGMGEDQHFAFALVFQHRGRAASREFVARKFGFVQQLHHEIPGRSA